MTHKDGIGASRDGINHPGYNFPKFIDNSAPDGVHMGQFTADLLAGADMFFEGVSRLAADKKTMKVMGIAGLAAVLAGFGTFTSIENTKAQGGVAIDGVVPGLGLQQWDRIVTLVGDNPLETYYRSAFESTRGPVDQINTFALFGSGEGETNLDSNRVRHSEQARMPGYRTGAIVKGVDGITYLMGAPSGSYFTGSNPETDTNIMTTQLVKVVDSWGIQTEVGFHPLFNADREGNPLITDSEITFKSVESGIGGSEATIATATSLPRIGAEDLTPQAPILSPEFIALQDQVAANGTENTVGNDGIIRNEKGEEYLGISANPKTGEITIMVDGAEITIEADKVTINDSGITVDGYTYDEASGDFDEIVTYTPETWASMDQTERDEALAQLPAKSPEGYTRGGYSTLEGLDNLVIYYDSNGDYAGSYDMFSGELVNTGHGPIEVFRTDDGGYYEMRAFGEVGQSEEQAKKAAEEMLYEAIVTDGVTYGEFSLHTAPNLDEFLLKLRTIKGLTDRGVDSHVRTSDGYLANFGGFELSGGMAFAYRSNEGDAKGLCLRGTRPTEFNNKAQLSSADGGYEIPAKPSN